MCVIAYIPKGVETPGHGTIEAMYKANPHGMGMCTPSRAYKGMKFDYLMANLYWRKIDEPCLIHFRLATHGSIKTMNCHPFWHKGTNTYFMHNGILNIWPVGDKTDSETAFRQCYVPMIKKFGFDSDELACMVKRTIGSSKFAFMQGDKVRLFGDFIERDGVFYSNLRFTNWLF